jgi:C-terminal processing protease CtpA/Prc
MARAKSSLSAKQIRNAHPAVRRLLSGAVSVDRFLKSARRKRLTARQRALIVDQAIVMLDGLYAHLPMKRGMYAIDPVHRLRLLRHRLPRMSDDMVFHAEMIDIFTSIRDRHTNYLLPAPYNSKIAWLPFKVESYLASDGPKYIVGNIAEWFQHRNFKPGVEILYWNGVAVARAVELAGRLTDSANPAARHAQGLQRLTACPLITSLPPDEKWVTVEYRDKNGRIREIDFEWVVSGPPDEGDDPLEPHGLSLETQRIQQMRKALFAPKVVHSSRRLAAAPNRLALLKDMESALPGYIQVAPRKTRHGEVGYVRLYSFDVPDADSLVDEFIRLIALLPQDGLIVDVRDNGGGRTSAAERMLQLIAPKQPIEPQRLYLRNTPLALKFSHLQKSNPEFGPYGLSPWVGSIERSMETGAVFSAAFPYTDPEACNDIGRCYPGNTIVVINALSYSATEFFAAGFQDHGGKVLGIDMASGGGGGNVRTHEDFRGYFRGTPHSPFKKLPHEIGFRVAIRRSMRVGPQSGNDVEDFGVTPDYFHNITRNDILNGNIDLITSAAGFL